MSIFFVFLMGAALVLSYCFGISSMLGAIRKNYPATYRALASEVREKKEARAAAHGNQEGAG